VLLLPLLAFCCTTAIYVGHVTVLQLVAVLAVPLMPCICSAQRAVDAYTVHFVTQRELRALY
jgi:hypothetical protein